MIALKNIPVRVALVLAITLTSGIASAQKFDSSNNQQTTRTATAGSGGSSYVKPNCPVSYVSANCLPRQKMPRAASKDECQCQVRRVNQGKTTLWVRDCYVQLPDETVYFCKNPIHQPPRG